MTTAATEKLRTEIAGHCLIIEINNPPANTWDLESLSALRKLVEDAQEDRNLRSIILTGAGEKFFSAGADLKLFASGDKGVAHEAACHFGAAFEALSGFRGLTIAAINGYAMGGGLECALACDLRIAEKQAKMALPEAKVGLLPCGGGTQNLAWLVGESWAKRIILCGEQVDTQTALRIGLIEEAVETGTALERAQAIAAMADGQSPLAVAACKELIQAARSRPLSAAYSAEREAFVELFGSADQREGVQAFLEKRPPQWKNA